MLTRTLAAVLLLLSWRTPVLADTHPMIITRAEMLDATNGTGVLRIVTVEDPPLISVRQSRFDKTDTIRSWNATDGTLQWSGWVMRLLSRVAETSGLKYTLELSPTSNNTFSYGHAVADVVQRRGPQAYVAGAYVTPPRLETSLMSASFSTSPLALMVKTERPSVVVAALIFLTPFTPTLWCCVVAMMLASHWLNRAVYKVDVLHSLSASARGRQKLLMGLRDRDVDSFGFVFAGRGRCAKCCQRMNQFCLNSRWSVRRGRWGKSDREDKTYKTVTLQGLLYLLVKYMVTLLFFAAYTAELTVVLTKSARKLPPSTFDAFGKGQLKACVLANSAYAAWMSKHVQYQHIKQVGCVCLSEMLANLVAGRCAGIIERKSHIDFLQHAGEFCDVQEGAVIQLTDTMPDGPQRLAFGFAMGPGMETLQRKVSYWITKAVAEGTVAELYEYENMKGGCAASGGGDGGDSYGGGSGVKTLGPGDFLGAMLLWATAALPVIIRYGFSKQNPWAATCRAWCSCCHFNNKHKEDLVHKAEAVAAQPGIALVATQVQLQRASLSGDGGDKVPPKHMGYTTPRQNRHGGGPRLRLRSSMSAPQLGHTTTGSGGGEEKRNPLLDKDGEGGGDGAGAGAGAGAAAAAAAAATNDDDDDVRRGENGGGGDGRV